MVQIPYNDEDKQNKTYFLSKVVLNLMLNAKEKPTENRDDLLTQQSIRCIVFFYRFEIFCLDTFWDIWLWFVSRRLPRREGTTEIVTEKTTQNDECATPSINTKIEKRDRMRPASLLSHCDLFIYSRRDVFFV